MTVVGVIILVFKVLHIVWEFEEQCTAVNCGGVQSSAFRCNAVKPENYVAWLFLKQETHKCLADPGDARGCSTNTSVIY